MILIVLLTSLTPIRVSAQQCPLDCKTKLEQCKDDCKVIIDAAKVEISALKQLNADKDQTITDLHTSLDTIAKDRDSDRQSLSSWYHNPFILIPAGVLLGGVGAIYLEHR